MFLISGATGNVGGELVRRLAVSGHAVRALSRDAAAARLDDDIEVVEGDLTELSTLDGALQEVKALFLIECGNEEKVAARARELGVRRIVFLSALAAATRPQMGIGRNHLAAESAVIASGLEWTILRPGQFASNALQWSEMIRRHGAVFAPFPDVAQPVIDPADVAAVAECALVSDRHAGKIYALTGTDVISPRARLAEIAAVIGRELRFHEITRDDARDHMIQRIPAPIVEASLELLGNPTAAEMEVVSTVYDVTGEPPRTFADWAVAHADGFR